RGRYGILLGAAIGAAVWIAWLVSLATGPGLHDRAGNVKGGDFVLFYAAGRIVAAHQADHLYDPDLEERIEYGLTGEWSGRHGLINPPFFALLFVPLAALPYLPAFALWRALAGLGAAAVLLAAITLALSVPATLAYFALGHSFATMLGERGFPTAKMHSLYSFFVLLLPGHLTAAAALTLLSSLAALAVV